MSDSSLRDVITDAIDTDSNVMRAVENVAALITAERAEVHAHYREIADWAVAEAKSLPYGLNNPGQQYADGIRDGLLDVAARIRKVTQL